MEILLLGFVIAIGITGIGVVIYLGTRRGEKCRGYPYNTLYGPLALGE